MFAGELGFARGGGGSPTTPHHPKQMQSGNRSIATTYIAERKCISTSRKHPTIHVSTHLTDMEEKQSTNPHGYVFPTSAGWQPTKR